MLRLNRFKIPAATCRRGSITFCLHVCGMHQLQTVHLFKDILSLFMPLTQSSSKNLLQLAQYPGNMFLLEHLRWPSLEILSYPGFLEVRCGTARMTSLENVFWGGSAVIVYGIFASAFFFNATVSRVGWDIGFSLIALYCTYLFDFCGCEVVLYIRSRSNWYWGRNWGWCTSLLNRHLEHPNGQTSQVSSWFSMLRVIAFACLRIACSGFGDLFLCPYGWN